MDDPVNLVPEFMYPQAALLVDLARKRHLLAETVGVELASILRDPMLSILTFSYPSMFWPYSLSHAAARKRWGQLKSALGEWVARAPIFTN